MLQHFCGQPEENEGMDESIYTLNPEHLYVENITCLRNGVQLWIPKQALLTATLFKDSQSDSGQ